jgi:hypothetical protein
MYPSSGGVFGRSVERREGEFPNFSDEIEVMPLLLFWSSPLRLSGAVPESESTVLD